MAGFYTAALSKSQALHWPGLSPPSTAIWTSVLMGAGYALGAEYDRIAGWAGPVSNVVIGGLVLVYVVRLVTFKAE